MEQLETNIEKSFKDYVEDSGCYYIKLELFHFAGMPDRLIIGPGKFILFLEWKRAGKRAGKLQQYRIDKLNQWGFAAYAVCRKQEAVAVFDTEQEIQTKGLPKERN